MFCVSLKFPWFDILSFYVDLAHIALFWLGIVNTLVFPVEQARFVVIMYFGMSFCNWN
jgi:hypothetical protein